MAEAVACGKLILLGEHFVLYGAPALVLAGGPKVRVQASRAEEDRLLSPSLSLDVRLAAAPPPAARPFASLLSRLKREAGYRGGVRLLIRSSIPVGQGLGSSGAVLVASAAAVNSLLGLGLSREELARVALEAEQLVHGRSSGIDVFAPLYGGLLLYSSGRGILRRRPRAGLPLVLAFSGVKRSTRRVIERVSSWREAHPHTFSLLARQVGSWAEEGFGLAEEGELERLGLLMTLNHCLLSLLGASHPRLDGLVNESLARGALGAKLSGGGGGGVAAVLVRKGQQGRLSRELRERGFRALPFRPSSEGVSVCGGSARKA